MASNQLQAISPPPEEERASKRRHLGGGEGDGRGSSVDEAGPSPAAVIVTARGGGDAAKSEQQVVKAEGEGQRERQEPAGQGEDEGGREQEQGGGNGKCMDAHLQEKQVSSSTAADGGEREPAAASMETEGEAAASAAAEGEAVRRPNTTKVNTASAANESPTSGQPSLRRSSSSDGGSGSIAAGAVLRAEGAAAEDKGSRHTMEDAWVVLDDVWAATDADGGGAAPSTAPADDRANDKLLRCSFYAVFDGHGGRKAADFAKKHLLPAVLAAGFPRESLDVKAAKRAIMEGFKNTDEALLKESAAGSWQDGATAVCVWVLDSTVIVANIGDAKAVLARATPQTDASSAAAPSATPSPSQRGQPPSKSAAAIATVSGSPRPGSSSLSTASRAAAAAGAAGREQAGPLGAEEGTLGRGSVKGIAVTREHKAIFPLERARIEKAGGSVVNGRIGGRLEVSRAFGDRLFKKSGVTAVPDVSVFEASQREHFLVLGCDGLWGVFGAKDAAEFVHSLFKQGLSTASVARRVVREAVWERKCKDNCTAIVVALHHAASHTSR